MDSNSLYLLFLKNLTINVSKINIFEEFIVLRLNNYLISTEFNELNYATRFSGFNVNIS